MPTPEMKAFMERLADIACEKLLGYFRQPIDVSNKGDGWFDPVTVADRATELAVREAIEKAFPDHGILGEEFGVTNPNADKVWVIDPIDGTRSFISGVPIWGMLLGLVENGGPSLGLMAQPFTGERFSGDGNVATYSGPGGPRTLQTRRCETVDKAVIFTTSPRDFTTSERSAYDRVEADAKLARYGTDCYAYCMVAAGFVDSVIETQLQPHDILPLIPIIEGAGGVVTDWQGNPPPTTGQVVVSGDARLHETILAKLAA